MYQNPGLFRKVTLDIQPAIIYISYLSLDHFFSSVFSCVSPHLQALFYLSSKILSPSLNEALH